MNLSYSSLARRDLKEIGKWSIERFGTVQTERYLSALEAACEEIARDPQLDRLHKGRLRGVRRKEHVSHVIFYVVHGSDTTISRILHKARLPVRHGL